MIFRTCVPKILYNRDSSNSMHASGVRTSESVGRHIRNEGRKPLINSQSPAGRHKAMLCIDAMLYAARSTGSKCLLGRFRGIPPLSRLHPGATIIPPYRAHSFADFARLFPILHDAFCIPWGLPLKSDSYFNVLRNLWGTRGIVP